MSETEFWRDTVRPKLIPFGVLHRIENVVELGTPDVVCCLRKTVQDGPGVSSWIELKYEPRWPVRSLFRFKRFTVDQAEWLYDWGAIGGKACVLAQVADEYLLIPSNHAKELQRGVLPDRMREMAAVRGEGVFPTGRMILWLTSRT